MCGIHAVIETVHADDDDDDDDDNDGDGDDNNAAAQPSALLRARLARRGPDHVGQVTTTRRATGSASGGRRPLVLRFTSTVLALRGHGLTAQPLVDATARRVLCWNGEVWRRTAGTQHAGDDGDDGDDDDGSGGDDDDQNDGQQLFARLTAAAATAAGGGGGGSTDAVLAVLRAVEGPFAFVYYDGPGGRLYYGRDRLGRRSLLRQVTGRGLVLASVSDVSAVSDPSDPSDASASAAATPSAAAWTEVAADGVYVVDLVHEAPTTGGTRHAWSDDAAAVDAAADAVHGLGRFNMADQPPAGDDGHRLALDAPPVQELRRQLAASLRLRVRHVPRPPRAAAGGGADTDADTNTDTRVAVLFSGGLDCTVLARMAHDLLPPDQGIDLINVAFENPRVRAHLVRAPRTDGTDGPDGVAGAAAADDVDVYEACPDRVTGRRSLAELQRACPGRRWRFLAVNVPYAAYVAHRPTVVALMHPHNTEMDLSIAAALYFAARGVAGPQDGPATATPARVLLSGLGADELFGGYGRHAVAYRRAGYAALARELHGDVARLGRRNLGRDDRVLAHWGREVRFPFLDERLVRWAIGLPVWAKCDFAHAADADGGGGGGVDPAKRILRLVALGLGLAGVAQEKKRAIQFGARTAKMVSGRVHGTAVVA